MTESVTVELQNRQQAHAVLKDKVYPFIGANLQAGKRLILQIKPETRSLASNRLMWSILKEFADQLEWPINGKMEKISAEDFKNILTAAFRRENVRIAQGMDGGVVMLGQHTRKFTKPEFSAWIEFLYSVAADRGVKLPAWDIDENF